MKILSIGRGEIEQHFKNPLFKNSYFLMITDISVSLFGFIFWIIVTRYYTPIEAGTAVAAISAALFIANLSGLGLGFGLIRYFSKWDDKQEIINSCFGLTGTSSIIFTAIFLAGLVYWSPKLLFIREEPRFLVSFITLTAIYSLFMIQNYIFIAARTAKLYLLQNLMFNIIRVPLPIMLLSFGLHGIILSWTIAVLVSFIVGCLLFVPMVELGYRPAIIINRDIIDKIIPYSFGNYIAGMLGSLPAMVLPLMTINILGPEKTAYYYMAYSVGSILSLVPIAVTTSLFAESSHDQRFFRPNIIKCTIFLTLLLIPATIGLLLLGNRVLSLFGESYSKNATMLLWLFGFSSFPFAVIQIYMTIQRVRLNIKPVIFINAFVASIIIFGSYVLMNKVGLIGIGIAWLSGMALTAFIISFYLIRGRL